MQEKFAIKVSFNMKYVGRIANIYGWFLHDRIFLFPAETQRIKLQNFFVSFRVHGWVY